jgi:hypothetical protein
MKETEYIEGPTAPNNFERLAAAALQPGKPKSSDKD